MAPVGPLDTGSGCAPCWTPYRWAWDERPVPHPSTSGGPFRRSALPKHSKHTLPSRRARFLTLLSPCGGAQQQHAVARGCGCGCGSGERRDRRAGGYRVILTSSAAQQHVDESEGSGEGGGAERGEGTDGRSSREPINRMWRGGTRRSASHRWLAANHRFLPGAQRWKRKREGSDFTFVLFHTSRSHLVTQSCIAHHAHVLPSITVGRHCGWSSPTPSPRRSPLVTPLPLRPGTPICGWCM